MTTKLPYTVPVTIQVQVFDEDFYHIIDQAMNAYDGIAHWCDYIEIPGEIPGPDPVKEVTKTLSHGKPIELIDIHGVSHQLNLGSLLAGLTKYLTEAPGPVDGDMLDPSSIDGPASDRILQYAIFGEEAFYIDE